MRLKRKRKISNVIVIICCLIFFLVYIFFKCYDAYANDKLIEVAYRIQEKYISSFLSNNIGYGLIKDNDLDKIINIEKNNDGEILFISYNLIDAYKVLDELTKEINNRINELENGKTNIYDENIVSINNHLVIKMPFFIASNSIFLTNLGPKIYVPIRFCNIVLTNLKTKVEEYGMNNALLKVYVNIKISIELFSPVSTIRKEIDYDTLISLNVVNGRVPSFFGDNNDKSNVFSVPIK